ncbi:glycosyltransferase family 2 protein [Paraburkholderia caballeronis]|uniref:Glycosyltransferase, GT2 family n=1 Tax=Paraburkholderia caballeronis TaxID=416943 RepID=A0A1H7T9I2_9BURK|nr:glycosyltransferase family 2 protein [Paraburkholderia caballeronis]PXW22695.1 GT2 family glycosyltransferase [Paraburkholderia caballeronis]PXW96798.1 GT2 family glycosyltransferase [Paraburkholderia caballeronis]RAJ93425.1 GT2 family glycosyltransferase [Paraburkholderia caballeronis]TDV32778.1 GT2 family glycosyltransferase [Paraburkholderia caballeronis]SEC71231.1 Glycosyltransferase, GT2 family [Paraburkholderia caballeronis]
MFSIIIPTWNNLPYLQLVIASLQRHSTQPHQIIVHVNDGSDGTLAWVREQRIEHTASPGNIGICHAVNLAAARATRDYVVYMNDDMYCCPGWDDALARRMAQMPSDLFMLSGTMIEPVDTGNPCVVVGDFGRDAAQFRADDLVAAAPSLARSDWRGATWPPTLVHRDWWIKVGGYSSELSPGMSSDNDFSMKLWDAGCRTFVGVGDSLVYHFQQKSTGKIVKNDGRRQFLNKWGITQATFDRFYLRRGQKIEGSDAVGEPQTDWRLKRALLKSRLKRALG